MGKKNTEKKKNNQESYVFKWDHENIVVSESDKSLPSDPSFKRLTESELLTLNTTDLDVYVEELSKKMKISKKEKVSLNKIRRRVRHSEQAYSLYLSLL